MAERFGRRLEKKLLQWQSQGIIDARQTEQIIAYEAEQHQSKSHWVLYGFLILGTVTTGIGIISLIADNWENIPGSVKLMVDFVLLGLLALGLYRLKESQHSHGFEALLVAYQLLCLASIGLISQVYHIQGDLHQALLTWSVMCFAITLYARRYFAVFLWVSLFLGSLSWSVLGWQATWLNGDFRSAEEPSFILLFAVFSSLLLAYLAQFFKHFRLMNSFRFWFVVIGICSLIFADIAHWTNELSSRLFSVTDLFFMPIYLLWFVFVVYMLLRPLPRFNRLILIIASVLYLLLFRPHWLGASLMESDLIQELYAPVLIISVLLLYAIHAASTGQKSLFNLLTFLIGLRFLIVYFEVIGDLALTGIGLMVSGLAIILVAYGWYQYRHHLQRYVMQSVGVKS